MQRLNRTMSRAWKPASVWWLAIALMLCACGNDGQTPACETQYDSASYALNRSIYRLGQVAIAQTEIFLWTTTRQCERDSLTISRDFKLTFPDKTQRCYTGVYQIILQNGPHMFSVEDAPCPE